jgi:tRNA pseudouridine65 synthase
MSTASEGFWSDIPFGPGVRTVHVDSNGLAALDKPEGVLSHPNAAGDESRSLLRAKYDEGRECYEWSGARKSLNRLWLVNRLDSATSGLILVAADGTLAHEVRAQFQRRLVRKRYQALVFGKPRHTTETWKDVLNVKKLGGQIRTAAAGGGLHAECAMRLLRTGSDPIRISLIELEPHTGRSHQLRVQCAKRGLPIVGDRTYGDFAANREFARAGGPKRMFLHSLAIAFKYDFGGMQFEFSADMPLPPSFKLAV